MNIRKAVTTTALAVALVLGGGTARAQEQACQPGIGGAFFGPHAGQYGAVVNAMIPVFGTLSTQLAATVNQMTYEALVTTANTLAGSLPTGRVVITLPDGTVVLDTNRDDNTGNANSNSYQHFLDKTINENHNSRLAILAAQEYACGVGVESKLSSTTGHTESYVAIRVGAQLDSIGTVRMSVQD